MQGTEYTVASTGRYDALEHGEQTHHTVVSMAERVLREHGVDNADTVAWERATVAYMAAYWVTLQA
jgi:hypothetical protein